MPLDDSQTVKHLRNAGGAAVLLESSHELLHVETPLYHIWPTVQFAKNSFAMFCRNPLQSENLNSSPRGAHIVMFVFSQQRRQSLCEAEHLLRMAEGKYDSSVVRCLVGTHGDLDDLEVPGTGYL